MAAMDEMFNDQPGRNRNFFEYSPMVPDFLCPFFEMMDMNGADFRNLLQRLFDHLMDIFQAFQKEHVF
ncbi:hypothetical protein HMPREF0322_02307 [Desulfitobacterium hafniense DP7]|uniref:Uncharacterized protein n=1 Tax=Desulfitobacterium hafniense DP7 TaxID=537010 RepID=G9XMW8_DESHA|nr:hypothetical protein HMPREF0322_02307 [Desulfitobacterium hafniense DP7]